MVSDFLFPATDEGPIQVIFSNLSPVFHIMEMLGAPEHQPVESTLIPDLHFPLVRVALALVLAAHVTAEPLSVLECFMTKRALMLLASAVSDNVIEHFTVCDCEVVGVTIFGFCVAV